MKWDDISSSFLSRFSIVLVKIPCNPTIMFIGKIVVPFTEFEVASRLLMQQLENNQGSVTVKISFFHRHKQYVFELCRVLSLSIFFLYLDYRSVNHKVPWAVLLKPAIYQSPGTLVSGLSVLCCSQVRPKQDTKRHCIWVNAGVALLQFLLTFLFLLGWIWSITWGLAFLAVSSKMRDNYDTFSAFAVVSNILAVGCQE